MFWLFWLLGLTVSTFLGAFVVRKWRHLGWGVLLVFLAIYITSANILVPRLITFDIGLTFVLVAGSVIWPFTAQIMDMINEIYGKKKAYVGAAISYLANLMFVGFVLMAMELPSIWGADNEAWWQMYFGVAGRVLLASTCSFTLANIADIHIFSIIKKWFWNKEKSTRNIIAFVGVRSATSDAANMVIDNLVFYTIAFAGTMPWEVLWSLIGSSMAAKVILSQIDLPFLAAFRFLTKDVEREM